MPVGKLQRHGLHALKRAIRVRGIESLDKRTTTSRAMVQYRTSLVAALGGPTHISPQRETIVDAIVRTKLYVDSIDTWLLQQRSLINARRRGVVPALRERQQLVDSLARLLSQVGLDRVEVIPSIDDYWARKNAAQEAADEESTPPDAQESQEPGIGSDATHDGDDQRANLAGDSLAEEEHP